MTAYYVRTTGSDAAAGTSAGAAWLTIGKAVSASTASGDTIWVGAGVYRLAAALAPTTRTSETFLYADTDGSQTGDAGEVRITGYSTNDSTAPMSDILLSFGNRNFWTLKGFTLVPGLANTTVYITGTSHDIKFQDCTIFGQCLTNNRFPIHLDSPTWSASQPINLTIERCRIFTANTQAIYLQALPASASGVDVDQNIVIRNCLIFSAGNSVRVSGTSNTKKSGGVQILNNFIFGNQAVVASDANISTTYPTLVYNNILFGTGGIQGTTTTTTENYNAIYASTPLTTVTQGANTKIDGSVSPHFLMGQELTYGAQLRPFGMFPAGHPGLAWGAAGTVTDDLLGGPRPGAGAGSVAKALGPYERNNSWVKETGTVRTGSNAISVTGPGYQDFVLPVDAVQTTVTVYLRYDSTYAGTLPSVKVLRGGECGVADGSALQVGAANAWEAVALTFTPSVKGIVTIRLLSSDTNGGGKVFADDLSVAWV